ncbi:MAG: sodium:calcium exchanger [Gemmatimonadota bacterium]
MSPWLWVLVLVAAVWAAHWGAERLAHPLEKLRQQWGFTAAAGGAFIGLAAASPEIGINTASAVRGVSEIGLGASLGSNILAIPLIVTAAYVASRAERLGQGRRRGTEGNDGRRAADDGSDEESPREHARHRREGLLRVQRSAVTVQALPYLAILAVFALLTLPAQWRGLQPVDGWILLGAYLAYLAQALLRGREEGEEVRWTRREVLLAVGGVAVLALGAYFIVRAMDSIVSALGISRIVGGLFITAPMAALPEVFATWSVTRSGQVTSATTSVIGDHAVTMTVAFLPLALVTLPIQDLPLFGVNLAFVALVPAAYAALIHWGSQEHGFKLWQVLVLDGTYIAYLAVVLFGVLKVL